MLFLHPIAIAIGAVLLALPVAVHLLTRPRPVRFPFSALRFLESALKQRRFFARLRDLILLLLRGALLAAIALAFARPLLEGPARAAPKGLSRAASSSSTAPAAWTPGAAASASSTAPAPWRSATCAGRATCAPT